MNRKKLSYEFDTLGRLFKELDSLKSSISRYSSLVEDTSVAKINEEYFTEYLKENKLVNTLPQYIIDKHDVEKGLVDSFFSTRTNLGSVQSIKSNSILSAESYLISNSDDYDYLDLEVQVEYAQDYNNRIEWYLELYQTTSDLFYYDQAEKLIRDANFKLFIRNLTSRVKNTYGRIKNKLVLTSGNVFKYIRLLIRKHQRLVLSGSEDEIEEFVLAHNPNRFQLILNSI